MSKVLLSFLVLFSLSGIAGEENPNPINEQRKIIQTLTGESQLADGSRILARSKKDERALTRKYLSDLILQLKLIPKEHNYTMPNINPLVDLLFDPFTGTNVYTTLPATKASNQYVILGAHFDSERNCPGAIDNASGVALAYGVMKKLSRMKNRDKHVILVFFDQEEEELVGSKAFAQYIQNQEFSVHSVHTFDTMGWDRDGDKAIELELPTPALEKIYRNHADKLGIPIHTTRVNSTDHQSFRALEFNAVGLTDEFVNKDYAPYKDTPNDTFDTVNFEYLDSCTSLVFEVVKDICTH